jgi:hypothetical protein
VPVRARATPAREVRYHAQREFDAAWKEADTKLTVELR